MIEREGERTRGRKEKSKRKKQIAEAELLARISASVVNVWIWTLSQLSNLFWELIFAKIGACLKLRSVFNSIEEVFEVASIGAVEFPPEGANFSAKNCS